MLDRNYNINRYYYTYIMNYINFCFKFVLIANDYLIGYSIYGYVDGI